MKAYVSLWSADLLAVGAAVDLIAEEADGLHIDVFDGHNVPDLLFGPDFVTALRAHTDALIDVHLNVDDPDLWAKHFAEAGADMITVQPRACPDVRATLNVIASAAVRPAVALEVGDPVESVFDLLEDVDRVLVMGTRLGVKGLDLDPAATERVAMLARGCSAELAAPGDRGRRRHPPHYRLRARDRRCRRRGARLAGLRRRRPCGRDRVDSRPTTRGARRMNALGREPLVIGIDLGGTKLAGALVDAGGTLDGHTRWPRPLRDYDDTVEAITAMVDGLRARAAETGRTVSAVGIAAAAFLDADRERVLQAANLGWRDRPLRADVGERVALPVVLQNDADAAAWGEYRHGAGAGARSLLLVTVGTGVGGGAIIDGHLLTGGSGLGGEIGHLIVQDGGLSCVCGARGCLEMYASGRALVRIARTRAEDDPDAAHLLLALADGDPDRLDGQLIVAAARRGDLVARDAINEIGHWLGRGLAQVTTLLDPALILVGGGVAAADELLLTPTRSAYAEALTTRSVRRAAPIRLAALPAAAGIIGAAAQARAAAIGPTTANERPCASSSPAVAGTPGPRRDGAVLTARLLPAPR